MASYPWCNKGLLLGTQLSEPGSLPPQEVRVKENNEDGLYFPHICLFHRVWFHFILTFQHWWWWWWWGGFSALRIVGLRKTHPLSIVPLLQDPLMSVYLKNCIHSCGKYGSYSTLMGRGLLWYFLQFWRKGQQFSQALDINNIVYAVSTLLVLCLCRP